MMKSAKPETTVSAVDKTTENLWHALSDAERVRFVEPNLPELYDWGETYAGNKVSVLDLTNNPTRSFKGRGAFNMLASQPYELLRQGVIAASAGNHAQGVAQATRILNEYYAREMPVSYAPFTAHIYMHRGVAACKREATARLGGDYVQIHEIGDSFDDAKAFGMQQPGVWVDPYDHELVMRGQGTVLDDIVQLCQRKHINPHTVRIFCAVGGGGLAGGLQMRAEECGLQTKIVGIQLEGADSAIRSREQNTRISLPHTNRLADGAAVGTPGELTLPFLKKLAGMLHVSVDQQAAEAARFMSHANSLKPSLGNKAYDIMPEPAALLAYAGARAYAEKSHKSGEHWIIVRSGGNVNWDIIQTLLEHHHGRQTRTIGNTAMQMG